MDPPCVIASAHGTKAALPKMIENRFGHDRTRGIEGAQEEYIERAVWLLAPVG
jgi:hypothetical protein